jgi:hypothetical protein
VAQLDAIVAQAIEARPRRLFTRLDAEKFHSLTRAHREALDYDDVSRTAFLGKRPRPGHRDPHRDPHRRQLRRPR